MWGRHHLALAQQKTLLGLADPIQMERGTQAGREEKTAEERAPLLFKEPPGAHSFLAGGLLEKILGICQPHRPHLP